MKVILTEDVYKHGVAGEVVSVADGFARNYLIPQGMALKATPGALNQLANLRAEADKRRQLRDEELQQIAEKIEGLTLAFPVKAGESGKLYGSVTSAHIAESIEEALGVSIDRRRIGDRPLRELGQHEVAVRLSTSLVPPVTVLVHREGEAPESVMDMVPSSEMEEEPSIFEEVMGEEFIEEEVEEEDLAIYQGEEAGEEEDSAIYQEEAASEIESETPPEEPDAPEDV